MLHLCVILVCAAFSRVALVCAVFSCVVLVCVIFSCVRTMVWLPMLGMFNVHANANPRDCHSLAVPRSHTCVSSMLGLMLNQLSCSPAQNGWHSPGSPWAVAEWASAPAASCCPCCLTAPTTSCVSCLPHRQHTRSVNLQFKTFFFLSLSRIQNKKFVSVIHISFNDGSLWQVVWCTRLSIQWSGVSPKNEKGFTLVPFF